MLKARMKNIIRNMKGNINRFLSIMFIVALGAGFMAGLAAASPDMYETADKYIKEYKLFDIDVKSPVGFDADATESIAELDEVDMLQTACVFDMVLDQDGGTDFTSRVFGLLGPDGETEINHLNLIEGRYPQDNTECVVESVFGKYSGETVHIGDTLTLSDNNKNYTLLHGYMANDQVTVVGVAESPMCLSVEGDSTNIGAGTIDLDVYVLSDFFTCDFYTDIFIAAKDSELHNTFDVSYDAYINSVIDTIKPLADSSLESRISRISSDLSISKSDIDSFRSYLGNMTDKEKQMEDNLGSYTVINDETAQLISGNGNLSELLTATSDLINSRDEIADPDTLPDAMEKLLIEAGDSLDLISEAVVIYRIRTDLTGVDSFLNNVSKVSSLAKIFPVFFFIVALLVALTTMSRLIEENRLQIGTLKAIGYSNGQVLAEYLMFSLAASILGCLLGFGVGFWIFPTAITSAYKMMYFMPDIATPIRWDIVAWVAPVTIVSILLAALISCWNEFRSVPARLMMPKSPPAGKRIWLEHIGFIWKKLSFNYKVTFRNLFRYKKRFIMTIIGVSGCSALLLTGFGIKDSVNEIIDIQFGKIFKYDMIFVVSDEDAIKEDINISEPLKDTDSISEYTTVCQEIGQIYFKNRKEEITLFIPSDESVFQDYIELRDRRSGQKYELTSDGIVLPEKLCEIMKIKAGDEVIIENGAGKQSTMKVTAITENYVYYFGYMTNDLYYSSFRSIPEYTSLLCKINDNLKSGSINENSENASNITSTIMRSNYVLYGRSAANLKETFSSSINSINGVIMVLIIAAGLLCIVVLYNLTNVNICERKKELATLSVLGFHKNETHSYIFRETNILSLIGAVIGLGIGIWLHSFVVRTVEINKMMFGRNIKPMSFVIALGISIFFTLIVDQIMKQPIDNTDMVEAMKAND